MADEPKSLKERIKTIPDPPGTPVQGDAARRTAEMSSQMALQRANEKIQVLTQQLKDAKEQNDWLHGIADKFMRLESALSNPAVHDADPLYDSLRDLALHLSQKYPEDDAPIVRRLQNFFVREVEVKLEGPETQVNGPDMDNDSRIR